MIEQIHRAVRYSYIVLGVYWFALFVATHTPLRNDIGGGVPNADKAAHFVAYAGLAFLLSCALYRAQKKAASRTITVLAIAALYAIADEATQVFVPNRVADFWDWVADMIGAGIGIAFFAVAVLIVRRFTGRPSFPA